MINNHFFNGISPPKNADRANFIQTPQPFSENLYTPPPIKRGNKPKTNKHKYTTYYTACVVHSTQHTPTIHQIKFCVLSELRYTLCGVQQDVYSV